MFLSSANIYFIRKQGEKKMQFDQHIETNPKFYLISWKLLELEKANNLTITRFIQVKLTTFFLPKSFPQKKNPFFLTSKLCRKRSQKPFSLCKYERLHYEFSFTDNIYLVLQFLLTIRWGTWMEAASFLCKSSQKNKDNYYGFMSIFSRLFCRECGL